MVLTNAQADEILSGREKVYSMDDLVSLLGLSKSTLERWRRNGVAQPTVRSTSNLFHGLGKPNLPRHLLKSLNQYEDEGSSFPEPDFYLGRSPRWKHSTIRAWMVANSN